MCWLPTGCALTARQRPKSACRLGTSKDCGGTIGPRIRINRLDDASARCSVSNRPDQPNDSCPFTPPSKTRSTFNAISHPAARSASSETKRSGRGEPPPRPEVSVPSKPPRRADPSWCDNASQGETDGGQTRSSCAILPDNRMRATVRVTTPRGLLRRGASQPFLQQAHAFTSAVARRLDWLRRCH